MVDRPSKLRMLWWKLTADPAAPMRHALKNAREGKMQFEAAIVRCESLCSRRSDPAERKHFTDLIESLKGYVVQAEISIADLNAEIVCTQELWRHQGRDFWRA